MSIKLLTKQHLEFLSLKGGCTGSSESTLVKMPHCWKSCVTAHYMISYYRLQSQRTDKEVSQYEKMLQEKEKNEGGFIYSSMFR